MKECVHFSLSAEKNFIWILLLGVKMMLYLALNEGINVGKDSILDMNENI